MHTFAEFTLLDWMALLTTIAALIAMIIILVLRIHQDGLKGVYEFAKDINNAVPVQDAIENAALNYVSVDFLKDITNKVIGLAMFAGKFDSTPEGQQAIQNFVDFITKVSDGKPNLPGPLNPPPGSGELTATRSALNSMAARP